MKNLNKLKLTPGLVIEINQKFNQKLDKIIENRFFDTFLIMGYKEGAGGKKFNTKSYENYKNLYNKRNHQNISEIREIINKHRNPEIESFIEDLTYKIS